jgi:hypothetical protein
VVPDMNVEQRQHRRLEIRLPLEFHCPSQGDEHVLRTITRNISTGGVYFEADISDQLPPPPAHSLLAVEMTIPPGEGYFPYEGRVRGLAEVLRCEPLSTTENAPTSRRMGIAARFSEPLKLAF